MSRTSTGKVRRMSENAHRAAIGAEIAVAAEDVEAAVADVDGGAADVTVVVAAGVTAEVMADTVVVAGIKTGPGIFTDKLIRSCDSHRSSFFLGRSFRPRGPGYSIPCLAKAARHGAPTFESSRPLKIKFRRYMDLFLEDLFGATRIEAQATRSHVSQRRRDMGHPHSSDSGQRKLKFGAKEESRPSFSFGRLFRRPGRKCSQTLRSMSFALPSRATGSAVGNRETFLRYASGIPHKWR